MKSSASARHARLFDDVVTALERDAVAVARRHVMKARATLGEDDALRGALAGLELACDLHADHGDGDGNDDGDGDGDVRLRELQARTASEPRAFGNAVGCVLSDCGERLGDARLLELADAWFAHLTATTPDAILLANHGLVLERLDRLDDAVAALARAVEIDPSFHAARLRLANAASRTGALARAAEAYRGYLAAFPDNAHEWISLAIVLCDMGELPDAEQAYWRAAGLEPANVSLHFNWLISAQRAGDLERARDAWKQLKAIAPHEWRTRLGEAYLLDQAGDAAAAFRIGREVFHDLAAERSVEDAAIDYVARRVSEIALRGHAAFRAEAEAFVEEVFGEEIFTDETLALVRALEQPSVPGLAGFALQLEALYRGGDEPFACFVNYRLLARDRDEAIAFARRFEERCGADDVRIRPEDVARQDACEGASHPGVCWRSGREAFPAEEFGIDE